LEQVWQCSESLSTEFRNAGSPSEVFGTLIPKIELTDWQESFIMLSIRNGKVTFLQVYKVRM